MMLYPEAYPWVGSVLYLEADPWTIPVLAGLPLVLEDVLYSKVYT